MKQSYVVLEYLKTRETPCTNKSGSRRRKKVVSARFWNFLWLCFVWLIAFFFSGHLFGLFHSLHVFLCLFFVCPSLSLFLSPILIFSLPISLSLSPLPSCNTGLQYCCGQVDRGIQPPSTLKNLRIMSKLWDFTVHPILDQFWPQESKSAVKNGLRSIFR